MKLSQCISEQIPNQKQKMLVADQFTDILSNTKPKELDFVRSSTGYNHEMTKDWVDIANP